MIQQLIHDGNLEAFDQKSAKTSLFPFGLTSETVSNAIIGRQTVLTLLRGMTSGKKVLPTGLRSVVVPITDQYVNPIILILNCQSPHLMFCYLWVLMGGSTAFFSSFSQGTMSTLCQNSSDRGGGSDFENSGAVCVFL